MQNLTPGNTIHGIYSKNFREEWTQEEKDFYNNTLTWYEENYNLEPADEIALDRFLVNSIKAMRADSVGMDYAIQQKVSLRSFEEVAIRQAETLGINRKYRLSKQNTENPTNVDLNYLFDLGEES
ncbi:hypothetical protein [Bacillus sp. UNC322MFChir4.1]|uniref:hypothetical protein n=1 Tax=Bacillus sp. UNC322MFChir4.1 TaxID=1449045 RepID=UPI001E50CD91|nr:hypothetical protein [Bacillus sp. UNC322MFChir4.1]